MPENIFEDEWRECLRAHYMSVIRENDHITLRTLKGVMHEVGFGDDELHELQVRATMRVEDVPDDFVPDLDILQPQDSAPTEAKIHPVGTTPVSSADGEASADLIAEVQEAQPEDDDSDEPPTAAAPTQLSLF